MGSSDTDDSLSGTLLEELDKETPEATLQAIVDMFMKMEEGMPKHIVIVFVEAIKKAHQYFEFKDHLRGQFGFKEDEVIPDDIKNVVRESEKYRNMYPQLGKSDIVVAAHALYFELYAEKLIKRKAKLSHLISDPKERDQNAFGNPIYKMVWESRDEEYAMSEDPRVELDKILRSDPLFYNDFFFAPKRRVQYSSLTVTVSYVSNDTTENHIRDHFRSCGDIEKISIYRGEWCPRAYVAFSTSQGADAAFHLTGSELLGEHLRVERTFLCEELTPSTPYESAADSLSTPFESAADTSKDAETTSCPKSAEDALKEYNELIHVRSKFIDHRRKIKNLREWLAKNNCDKTVSTGGNGSSSDEENPVLDAGGGEELGTMTYKGTKRRKASPSRTGNLVDSMDCDYSSLTPEEQSIMNQARRIMEKLRRNNQS